MLKAVFFDLDGTLLQMHQEQFLKIYFGELAKKMVQYGFDPKKLIQGLTSGTEAMVRNDGNETNEVRFWEVFDAILEIDHHDHEEEFLDFYRNEFDLAQVACGASDTSKEIIEYAKTKGLRLVMATNPLFPSVATSKRIKWAGLNEDDFEWVTTYEKCHYCKPNPLYFQEILDHCGLKPEEVWMVGNDVKEDMAAQSIGIKTHVITDHLIVGEAKDIPADFIGTLVEFKEYFKNKLG